MNGGRPTEEARSKRAARRGHRDDEVAYLAYHDGLTGLANRVALQDLLEETIERASRDGRPLALVYIDLDDFKLVNDSLGHEAGDELLIEVAARLRTVTRPGDVLARQGGDEFLLLISDPDGGAGSASGLAETVAQRCWFELRAALDRPFEIGDAVFQIDASLGVSVFPDDAGDSQTLLRHADAAMYGAKRAGGGFAVYEAQRRDPLARLSLAARMRRALAAEEFELHYQPVCDLGESLPVRGVESLVRWRDPERGLVPPLEFIPEAERMGVIEALGDWVLQEATQQARAWREQGLAPMVSVNVSPRELRRPGFAENFITVIEARGLEPAGFIVELTESSWVLETTRIMPVLEALSEAGVRLALDDFGAGYSSLARLRALPADIIKIDRAFLEGIPEDPQARAIVSAILALADACGRDVVAEGVETEGQLRFLAECGCRIAQGYQICPPGPAADVTPMIRARLLDHRRLGPPAR